MVDVFQGLGLAEPLKYSVDAAWALGASADAHPHDTRAIRMALRMAFPVAKLVAVDSDVGTALLHQSGK
jgi:hypothetical protein